MKSVSTNILEGIKKRKLVEGKKVDYYGLEEYIEDNFDEEISPGYDQIEGLFSDYQIADFIFNEGFDEEEDEEEDIDIALFDKVYNDVVTFTSKKEAEITKYVKEVLKKYNYCRAKVGKGKKIS